MKVNINKEQLQKALGKLQGVVEKRTFYPILSHFLLNAEGEVLSLEATDLQVSLKEQLEALVIERGSICLPARKLYEILRALPIGTLELSQTPNFWTSISIGNVCMSLPGLDPRDFPRFTSDGEPFFLVDSSLLKKMMKKVAFCSSNQESSMNLHGILFETEGDKLRMVATDGHRLALCEQEVEVLKEASVVLPKKGLQEIRRVFQEEERLSVKIQQSAVEFQGRSSCLSIRALEGRFPEYRYVLPKGFENHLVIQREIFLQVLKRGEVFAAEGVQGVKFSFEEGRMHVKAGGPETGEFSESLEVRYEGRPLSVTFNPRYLIEALNAMEGELVRFELRDAESAGLLKEEGSENYLYVVMPMKSIE